MGWGCRCWPRMRGGPSTRKLVGGEQVPGDLPRAARGWVGLHPRPPRILPSQDLSERPWLGPRLRLSLGAASPRGAGCCQPGLSGGGRPVRTRDLSQAGGCPWGTPARGGRDRASSPVRSVCFPSRPLCCRLGRRPWRALRATLRHLLTAYSVGVRPRFPSIRNKSG